MSKYGTNMTLIANTTPALKPAIQFPAPTVTFIDTYETAALSSDNVILARVQPGDRVVGGRLQWDALGSGVKLTVGDTLDCDRLMYQVDGSISNGNPASGAIAGCGHFNAIDGMNYVYPNPCDIFVNISGGAATGTITLELRIIRPGT